MLIRFLNKYHAKRAVSIFKILKFIKPEEAMKKKLKENIDEN